MDRYAILVEGAFNYIFAKTGNMLLRYKPGQVAAVIDSEKAGLTARDVIGFGGDVPVVSNFAEAKKYNPDTLILGDAPQGGAITDYYRQEIMAAIQAGCQIISGMHAFLNNDSEIEELARQYEVDIIDLRRPPKPPHFPKGTWKDRKVPVVLIVGTDCDTGKMTTAWELTIRLHARGLKVNFVGTGQTGILLGGYGVPVDAVVADFMAGEIEFAIDNVSENVDLIIVEGQGSITSMLYSGVTLGLLHGAMPDFLVMTHEPERILDVADHPMVDIRQSMQLHLDLMKPFKESRFVGLNLLTYTQTESKALRTVEQYEQMLSLPATDLIRFGNRDLIEYIDQAIQQWS